MESQDGISVRPMRLKVLYTFDDANKTNCLARWPNLLEVQTAFLDEKTQIGVIELKTCIQAIVSASPELVAKLGQDYTVYAYDYSENETPLVGQGMLSWVLASPSPTPAAPAHQSKAMVTGRVCKNVLGLFSKGAQETLEVKLRLVPVPTVMQCEYLDSMQRYRDLSNIIPHGFDPQTWTNYIRQNPEVMADVKVRQSEQAAVSPMDHSGIERFHQILSEGSTPRDLAAMAPNEPLRPLSPAQSATSIAPPSRISTPGGQHPPQQPQPLQTQQHEQSRDMIRPSSSASMHDSELPTQVSYAGRRDSIHSGYGSADESADPQQRKRAKLYRAEAPGRTELNIERQPSSLRVAASTAASVRIHRPTPVNPTGVPAQASTDEPIRPPTPISGPGDLPRKARPSTSLLRESVQNARYTSPYPMSDDQPTVELNAHSPEETRYQGLFEPSVTMPSSPPLLDHGFPSRSSPNLPPLATDPDSGFMSGGLEEIMDEDLGTPMEDCTTNDANRKKHTVRPAIRASSPASAPPGPDNQNDCFVVEQPTKESAPPLPQAPASVSGSRPSSRASIRQGPKPLAPAPISQSELEQLMNTVPASDPVTHSYPSLQHSNTWPHPMSDFSAAETPAPIVTADDTRVRSGAGARRQKQIHARLDKCIKSGKAPPYCENCGAIETPTWRRAWSKELSGSEDDANDCKKDTTMLFWQSVERDDEDKVTKFKIWKKTLVDNDKDFNQVLLCNPCGLWLHKFKSMRPEHKWNKANNTGNSNSKRKRPARRTGPLTNHPTATGNQLKLQSAKPAGLSPAATDASSPTADEGPTPRVEDSKDSNDDQDTPSKRYRANSHEPRKTSDNVESRWKEKDPMEALRRAIQSSPAPKLEKRDSQAVGENTRTPKPVRRNLFPNSQNERPLKALGDSVINSPRRSPRIASHSDKRSQDKENVGPGAQDNWDGLFEGPGFDFDLPASPTPKRRNPRANMLGEKRLALLCNSPTRTRKNVDSDMSPTKITAQKLQRIQESPSRQNKSPKQSRPDASDFDLPSMSEGLNTDNFESIMDILNDDHPDSFLFDPTWLPSDNVSPESDDQEDGTNDDDDFINLIMSDPEFHNKDLRDPFGDSNVLDPDLFGSDFLGLDVETNTEQSQTQPEIHSNEHSTS